MRDRVPLVAVLLLTAACGAGEAAVQGGASGWSATPGQVAATPTTTPRRDHVDPVELRIPSIGVRSRLDRLALDGQGVLIPPRDPGRAGWFAEGVQPGDSGPAVIAGHVDSKTGDAVFTKLPGLRPGAEIIVTDASGGVARFAVDGVQTYLKAQFPTKDVYGPTPDPQLRLITCGGDFDRVRGHYVRNVVIYASLSE